MLELKPDFDESVTLADSSLNPRLRVVTHLFEQWRMKNHGGREGDTMLKVWPLSDQKKGANSTVHKILDGKHQIDANDRRTLMAEFLAIMDSLTKESACHFFETALSSQTANKSFEKGQLLLATDSGKGRRPVK